MEDISSEVIMLPLEWETEEEFTFQVPVLTVQSHNNDYSDQIPETDNANSINLQQEDESNRIQQTCPSKSRKRKRQPHTWKRNIAKESRYKAKSLPSPPNCDHSGGAFKCNELSMQDIRRAHQKFYDKPNRESQNHFILQHISVKSPKVTESKKQLVTTFNLPARRGNKTQYVRVCRAAFLQILQIGRDRVHRLCQALLINDSAPAEKRGGDKRSNLYKEKKDAIMTHVKSFVPLQSHYSRRKNSMRQYLDNDLNISKMWSLFTAAHPNLTVTYDYYRTVLTENFNIGFGSPAIDKCSTCTSLESRISATSHHAERMELEAEMKAHKIRYNVFFEKLRENVEGELTFSYDCQKNLVLPKVPDQAAYYSRQLYLYNFTMCQGVSGESQNTSNTFSYYWTENEYSKGSNEIASACHHRLCNTNMEGIQKLRMFSDGCGGQNKNKTVIAMLCHWFIHESPPSIQQIQIWFPIVGHSFIPPDRVFGNMERQINKKSVIENPDRYIDVMQKFSTVIPLRESPVRDWKTYSDEILKNPGQWHFQFQKSKKIILTRSVNKKHCLVQGEPFYNFECGSPKVIVKRNKNFKKNFLPSLLPRGIKLKEPKIKDVKKLLALHFGAEWDENENLQFYKIVFAEQTEIHDEPNDQLNEFELMDDEDQNPM